MNCLDRQSGAMRAPVAGALALAAIAIPLAWGSAQFITQEITAPRIDPQSFCPANAPLPADTVVIVDRTDLLSTRHTHALQREIDQLVDTRHPAIPARGQVAIVQIDGASLGFDRAIETVCRPPLTQAESETGATEKRLRPAFERYSHRLRTASRKSAESAQISDASPLFEALSQTASRPDFARATQRRIILVSDLLQNVPGHFSERDFSSVSVDQLLQTPYGKDTRADLQGVFVKILYLERKDRTGLQTDRHQLWWRTYLTALGATVTEFERIPE